MGSPSTHAPIRDSTLLCCRRLGRKEEKRGGGGLYNRVGLSNDPTINIIIHVLDSVTSWPQLVSKSSPALVCLNLPSVAR